MKGTIIVVTMRRNSYIQQIQGETDDTANTR